TTRRTGRWSRIGDRSSDSCRRLRRGYNAPIHRSRSPLPLPASLVSPLMGTSNTLGLGAPAPVSRAFMWRGVAWVGRVTRQSLEGIGEAARFAGETVVAL